ncbi:MAG: hypothetical protein ACREL3_04825 [Gemmatimonadales bacterium]
MTTDGTTPAPEKGKPSSPTPPGKPGLTYRPAPATAYRLERHDSLTLQYPGGAVQQQVRDRIAFVQVTVADAGGGATYPLTIVLDSLQALENGQPVDSAIAAKGTRFAGTLDTDGALSQLKADRGGTLSDELSGRLRALFPRLPPAGVREGMEWTDSSEYKLVADAFPVTEKQVTTYHATESTGSRKGVTLESMGTYTRSGTRQQDDQSLEMAATGARHAVYQISGDGTILSAQGNDSGDMTITVPAVGQTVPVKQTGSFSISPIAGR